MDWDWKPHVPVAMRRRKAQKELEKARGKGQALSPVSVAGRAIATTFWGKAWCQNLERYSDYSNRLPRGRSYARNGAVIDLNIGAGVVAARVSGSSLYRTTVTVSALPKARWRAIAADCAGSIDSLVELMQGRLSKGVMERVSREGVGLFPAPREIAFECSCPDWARMCKHVAAVLYGVGARLDESPE
ncbi:MAG: SWIM zinc finger family protein, partial [Planctomycetota bacterium]